MEHYEKFLQKFYKKVEEQLNRLSKSYYSYKDYLKNITLLDCDVKLNSNSVVPIFFYCSNKENIAYILWNPSIEYYFTSEYMVKSEVKKKVSSCTPVEVMHPRKVLEEWDEIKAHFKEFKDSITAIESLDKFFLKFDLEL